MRTKHFGIRKPEITKRGESREIGILSFRNFERSEDRAFRQQKPKITKGGGSWDTGIFGILEIGFSEVLRTGSQALCVDEPQEDYGHMRGGHMD
jgi:hypothetical protein